MERILAHHKFENVIFYKSGSEGYPLCLNIATYNVLQQNLDTPILILEDDIVFRKNPNFIYDIPDNSDAVYFGISGNCANSEFTRNRLVVSGDYELYNDTFFQVKNMLSTHAILYLGKEYKKIVSENVLAQESPSDLIICKFLSVFRIYGLCQPLCWQSEKLGNRNWNEHITKVIYKESGCYHYPYEEDDSCF